MPRPLRTMIDVWRNARDRKAGMPTYGQSPLAVRSTKLESDSSQTSKASWRIARKNISSGVSVMTTGSTPSIATAPSISGRLRS
jgi:hypothetical protein